MVRTNKKVFIFISNGLIQNAKGETLKVHKENIISNKTRSVAFSPKIGVYLPFD